MLLSLLVLIFSVNFIRKKVDLDGIPYILKTSLVWMPILGGFMITLGGFALGKYKPTLGLIWFLLQAIVVYILWLKKTQKLVNPLFVVNLVFLVVSTITELVTFWTPRFYNKYENYFDYTFFGAAVTVFGFLISFKNQAKALQQEADKNILVSKQNDELEKLVHERTLEINSQKDELLKTLDNLKATQAKLIQTEKLASLGELTAGIAHEIQNPLNFVNNFSEVSIELIEELKEENKKPTSDRDSSLQVEILSDLESNLKKIGHHGNRASSIVKNMLEHSRTSTGKRESIDLNKLCDEYVRLSYHGLRAKNKTFNAAFEAILDEQVPPIQVVSQDFGRVLLNIINNAFYAVKLRSEKNIEGYKPKVIVRTLYNPNADKVEINIMDNGDGITAEDQAKIFQPFFTTKPAGEGTGLGLSLSHEIIKAHGGDISLKTKVNEGTEFIISIPIK